jgi:hypothetical protein
MFHALSPRARALPLHLGLAGLLVLSGCVSDASRDPLGLDPSGASPSHATTGELLYGTGGTVVTDNRFAADDWADARVSEPFAVHTASGVANVVLRVMNNDSHLFVSARLDRPLSGSNQDVFTVLLEKGGRVNAFGLRFGTPFDEHCGLEGEVPVGCRPDAEVNATGRRFGSGGGSTYEVAFPLANDAAGQDLWLVPGDLPNVRIVFTPASAPSTSWPATGWGRIRVTGTPSQDVDVVVNVVDLQGGPCDVTVVMRSDDEYRLQRASGMRVDPVTNRCTATTTFAGVPRGSRPVFSALAAVFTLREHRFVWPTSSVPVADLPGNLEGSVFLQDPTGPFGQGASARLLPSNIHQAFRQRVELTSDGTITIVLGRGNTRVATCAADLSGFVFSMYPLDPTQLPPALTRFLPASGPTADWYQAGVDGCRLVVANDVSVVVEARHEDGRISSGTLPPGATFVNLTMDPGIFFRYYIDDPIGDNGVAEDVGLVVVGTKRNPDGSQGDALSVKAEVRGNTPGGTSWFRFELVDLKDQNGSTVLDRYEVKAGCDKATGSCTLFGQTSSGKTRQASVGGSVDDRGNGYVQMELDFQGIHSAGIRLVGYSTSSFDHAPDLGRTSAPHILNGFLNWVRTALPGSSWEIAWP